MLKENLNGSILKVAGKYEVSLNNIKDKNIKGNVVISIRPEEFVIDENQTKGGMRAFIDSSVFLGFKYSLFCTFRKWRKNWNSSRI